MPDGVFTPFAAFRMNPVRLLSPNPGDGTANPVPLWNGRASLADRVARRRCDDNVVEEEPSPSGRGQGEGKSARCIDDFVASVSASGPHPIPSPRGRGASPQPCPATTPWYPYCRTTSPISGEATSMGLTSAPCSAIEVTCKPAWPQGLMFPNGPRSMATLRLRPWKQQPLRTRSPSEAILAPST